MDSGGSNLSRGFRRRALWVSLAAFSVCLPACLNMLPTSATSDEPAVSNNETAAPSEETQLAAAPKSAAPSGAAKPEAAGLDPQRAYGYLVKICRIGTRVSGSEGMVAQQKLLTDHFENFDAEVRFQSFDSPHPLHGNPVRMNNMIVSWHPQAKERVLIACHYDTRPFPDEDRADPRGTFLGANDGASGVALLMELSHHMAKLKPTYGVDFVFFDAEELVFQRTGKFFLGSEHFAKRYRDDPPEHKYVCGIVVDMVGDKNLRLGQEKNSRKYAPDLVDAVWDVAKKLNIKEFVPRVEYEVQDDHLPLNDVAKIPTIDIIDFDYPHWHTTKDVPQNCSGQSLVKVGQVLLAWMERVTPPKK
jgi:glutaminyl-peptide cyclotransferase